MRQSLDVKDFLDFLNENENLTPEDIFARHLAEEEEEVESVEEEEEAKEKEEIAEEEETTEDKKEEGDEREEAEPQTNPFLPSEQKSEEVEEKEETTKTVATGQCHGKVVLLNGYMSNVGETHANKCITDAISQKMGCEVKELNLYQLNITAVSDAGTEPFDGMVQVYDAVDAADIVIFSTDCKNGQFSSTMQLCMERMAAHYKALKNKVFATVLTGCEQSYVSARTSLLNFGLNMGMIIGADCQMFCCVDEKGEACDFETNSRNFAVCANELTKATSSIRTQCEDQEDCDADTIKSYDQFTENDLPKFDPEKDNEDAEIRPFRAEEKEESEEEETVEEEEERVVTQEDDEAVKTDEEEEEAEVEEEEEEFELGDTLSFEEFEKTQR